MNKVLIISDNFELVKFIKELEGDINSADLLIDYKFSVINKNPEKLVSLGMTSINVKDEKNVIDVIKTYSVVFSAHCKQIFPKNLVENIRCINIHPGLNPHNRGWYPQVFSIINKLPIGCTIHEMNELVDHGSTIYQKEVNIYQDDTSLDVYNRVQNAEKQLLKDNFMNLIIGDYQATPIQDDGNYNGISDFNDLCKLDLDHQGTFREHLDILRALSHGDFLNAYFIDNSGRKVFLNINVEKEKISE